MRLFHYSAIYVKAYVPEMRLFFLEQHRTIASSSLSRLFAELCGVALVFYDTKEKVQSM